jgi:hypothetical protein
VANDRKNSAELEQDAERARAQLATTLDEFRARMTPGQVLDEVVDYARESGGADFLRNLSAQVRANPLPITLVGAGLAWLMMSRTTGRPASTIASAEPARAKEPSATSALADAAGDTVSSMRHSVENARETVTQAYEGASDTASRIGGRAAGASSAAADWVARISREQPLVIGAIGIGIGAALGAAFPSTNVEDSLFGESSDALKRDAQAAASQQYEAAKEAGAETLEAAQDAAERHGLVPDDDAGRDNTADRSGNAEGPASHSRADDERALRERSTPHSPRWSREVMPS